MEKSLDLTYEKEILARHGLTITTTDMPGHLHVKIFEGNKDITQWLKPSVFAGWVQGFVYAMRRQEALAKDLKQA